MTPEMERELLELSTFFHPEPRTVFRRVLHTIDRLYRTMAMFNLRAGQEMVFEEVVNPHPNLANVPAIALYDTH
jgi:hypothetical protein